MSTPAISVGGLGKRYQLGTGRSHDTLRDHLAHGASALFRRLAGRPQPLDGKAEGSGTFWALRDVSFELEEGEVVGIIGRNGAGKSTLLKILSQITEPTTGEVKVRGRVASLLEVGTGFHPELSGRENVYLNGAILGMRKAEIRRKFDEIVAFAEVEKFLDTPVKRYSSGMYVRLAFAVAAHLDPDILIVDEVLAVGDAEFQKKCLGKMGEVATQGGRTVLFVSHNMHAVTTLCSRAILLEQGRVTSQGDANQVIEAYLAGAGNDTTEKRQQSWADINGAPGNEVVRVRRVAVVPEGQDLDSGINMQTAFRVEVDYVILLRGSKLALDICLYSVDGAGVFEDLILLEEASNSSNGTQLFRTSCLIPGNLMNEGSYRVRVLFFDFESLGHLCDLKEAATFTVADVTKREFLWHGKYIGFVHPKLKWSTQTDMPEPDVFSPARSGAAGGRNP